MAQSKLCFVKVLIFKFRGLKHHNLNVLTRWNYFQMIC